MPTIWVREFTGGLDARRMPETTPGGSLIVAQDGHISRGGEFEKRAAFVPAYTVPSTTEGLARNRASLVVFGTAAGVTVPSGVEYQRIQHPDGLDLAYVPSFDLFAAKLYVAGQYEDGSIYHFYDGVRVADWYDGRARSEFTVVSGTNTAAVAATGAFTITAGTSGSSNEVTNVQVAGVSIIASPVAWTTSNSATASAVASAINSHTSTPDYTATALGATVTITAVTAGAAANGRVVSVAVGGDVTVGSVADMAGGSNAIVSRVESITVNGVSVISAPVSWASTAQVMAAAIASAIQSSISSPEYDATAVDAKVNLIAADAGAAPNGYSVMITTSGGLVITPSSGITMSGGASSDDAFTPGPFVKTFQSKVYAVSGPNLHFSGIAQPTQWTADVVGAGFIDMSGQSSEASSLTAVAPYQGKLAVFAETSIQIEFVDVDPANNALSQVLGNTGAVSGNSVTQFGDSDLFYCSESGLRSLRARDASNAAASNDVGVPVDTLIVEKLRELTEQERAQIIGLIEPTDNRFWLIMKDTIFVFSFFPGSKVSAWSIYKPGFDVEYATVFDRKVFLRSANTIYVYGGLGDEPVYDDTEAVARMPYLDANTPWQRKNWIGVDAALVGTWSVRFYMDPVNPDENDLVCNLDETSYGKFTVPSAGSSAFISPLFRSTNDGYAKLASIAIHYAPDDSDDD